MRKLLMIAAVVSLGIVSSFESGPVLGQSAFRSNFDHFSTTFPLEGFHRNADCQRCHVGGIFQGTPRECSTCHARAGLVRATPMPPDHILSTTLCQDCHLETTWSPVRRVDHSQVIGSCNSCHNGRAATGKPVNHPQSGEQCETCHRTNAWIPAGFDHSNVMGNCFSCHNGTTAEGKDLTHINTTNVCEDCHRTTTWSPVIRVDHLQVLGMCSSCHDGTTAEGKDVGHITSSEACDDCHTTNAWTPAVFDHANITGACMTCHNGTTATGKDNGHFTTARDCSYCHDSNFWIPLQFMHTSPGYPGNHRQQLTCTDCHGGNAEVVTWPFAAYQPDCAGCHAGDFESGPHKKHENPDVKYTVGEIRNCSGACHVYTDSTLTTIKESRPGPEHRVNDGGF
jgi:predicted CXXCH cytochrome family protein